MRKPIPNKMKITLMTILFLLPVLLGCGGPKMKSITAWVDNRGGTQAVLSLGSFSVTVQAGETVKQSFPIPDSDPLAGLKLNGQEIWKMPTSKQVEKTLKETGGLEPAVFLDLSGKRCYMWYEQEYNPTGKTIEAPAATIFKGSYGYYLEPPYGEIDDFLQKEPQTIMGKDFITHRNEWQETDCRGLF